MLFQSSKCGLGLCTITVAICGLVVWNYMEINSKCFCAKWHVPFILIPDATYSDIAELIILGPHLYSSIAIS
eukprot:4744562-Amphidinium_carterae.2